MISFWDNPNKYKQSYSHLMRPFSKVEIRIVVYLTHPHPLFILVSSQCIEANSNLSRFTYNVNSPTYSVVIHYVLIFLIFVSLSISYSYYYVDIVMFIIQWITFPVCKSITTLSCSRSCVIFLINICLLSLVWLCLWSVTRPCFFRQDHYCICLL